MEIISNEYVKVLETFDKSRYEEFAEQAAKISNPECFKIFIQMQDGSSNINKRSYNECRKQYHNADIDQSNNPLVYLGISDPKVKISISSSVTNLGLLADTPR